MGLDQWVQYAEKEDGSSWAKRAGGTRYDWGRRVALDSEGNCYITGFYEEIADFGPFILTSYGPYYSRDIFIAKLNSSGYWQWARSAGGKSLDEGFDIAVDTEGNVYVTGVCDAYNTSYFGPFNVTVDGLCIFVAKLNNTGDWQWVQYAEKEDGSSWAEGQGIDVDGNGNIYVTGWFGNGDYYFGPHLVSDSDGYKDIFIAKLNSSGEWQWAKSTNGTVNVETGHISVDNVGNCYINGDFEGTTYFGPFNLTVNTGPDNYPDLYIAKLNSNGDWLWAKSAGGNGHDYGNGIAVDGDGNAIITGRFGHHGSYIVFGPYNLTSPSPGMSSDIFIAKINNTGAWQWARSAGGEFSDIGYGVDVDGNGNPYITGYYSGMCYFGPFSLTSVSSYDVFVAKLNSTGEWQWVKSAGGDLGDIGEGIAVDDYGFNVYVTGYFNSNIFFGDYELTSVGVVEIFIAKLSDDMGNQPPVACYTWYDVDAGGSETMINFNASCSSDDYGINTYEWDWTNDGSYDYTGGPLVSHDYGDTSMYTCALRVTDIFGTTDVFLGTVWAQVDWPLCKMHYPQIPDPHGWDVFAMMPDYILADDFMCIESGPITDLHFWGSWFEDMIPPPGDGKPEIGFHISFYADIPDPDGDGPLYSMPGELLWERDVLSEQVECIPEVPSLQGWFEPPDVFNPSVTCSWCVIRRITSYHK